MRLLFRALAGRATNRAASGRMFLFFLGVTFMSEVFVMILMAVGFPSGTPRAAVAIIDASLLTMVLGPLVWWVFIRPMQSLHDVRGRLLERLMASQEDERRRIASDLHDGLGQELTSILLRARVLGQITEEPRVRESAESIREIAASALDGIRRVVRETRPPVLDDIGLEAAIERQGRDLAEASGIAIGLKWLAAPGVRWHPDTETALYRIVQEAVVNAVKHSGARHIDVAIREEDGRITVSVADDGTGFGVKGVLEGQRRPFGLLNMRERAAQVGGTVTFHGTEGRGSTVTVVVPVDRRRNP